MKTFKWVLPLLSILLLLSGCVPPLPIAEDSVKEIYYDAEKYRSEFHQRLQYQQLSTPERNCYGQIYTALLDGIEIDSMILDNNEQKRPGIRIPLQNAHLSKEDMARLFEAFFHDNPQFFYLDRTYSLEGREIDGKTVYEALVLQYTMDATQRKSASKQLDDIVATIFKNLPDSDDDFITELHLHDQLLARCSYDTHAAAGDAQEFADAYTAFGALVKGKAVCEGYARAMQLLLEKASIPSTLYIGYTLKDQEAHMWNVVKINGAYYHLDATWNDDNDHQQYAYFNIKTADIQRTHKVNSDQTVLLDCNESRDNYFVRTGTHIDTYERDEIAKTIADFINRGNTTIHLRFADKKYENGLLFLKNSSLVKSKVDPFLDADTSMWDYELRTLSAQKTITLYKKTD